MAGTDNDQAQVPTDEASIRQLVETANAEDEKLKQAAGDDTDDDDDSDNDDSSDDAGAKKTDKADDSDNADDSDDDDDDSDDADNPDDKKSQTERKFTQYKGDGTDQSYISNLEKAHQSSTTEAINLRTELNQATGRVEAIMRAAAADPELATKLNAAVNGAGTGDDGGSDKTSATDNPFVADLQAQWKEKSEKEIDQFIEANPEVASDPKVKADVQYWMGVFSNNHYERTGRLLSGGEAMSQAYNHLGLENKLSKQNLAAGAKKTATPTRARGKSKQTTSQKTTFTDDQIAMAKSMGKDQAWLEKNAK
jgi:hypothetical protein